MRLDCSAGTPIQFYNAIDFNNHEPVNFTLDQLNHPSSNSQILLNSGTRATIRLNGINNVWDINNTFTKITSTALNDEYDFRVAAGQKLIFTNSSGG
jgi:hypothetical protein